MIRKKLLYCGQNYDIMDKTIVLYGEQWNFDLRRKKKHGRKSKTKKLLFIMEKTMVK